LPAAAASCARNERVRKGSSVRVRQRAPLACKQSRGIRGALGFTAIAGIGPKRATAQPAGDRRFRCRSASWARVAG
jgi:hypothetical protein